MTVYNSPYYGGGVEQVVKNLVDNFSSDFKENLRLICDDVSREDEFQYNKIKCINLKNDRHHIVDRLFFWGRFVYSYRIYKFLKAQAQDGDVVNIHGIEYALFTSLFRHKIPAKIKLIVASHGSNFAGSTRYQTWGLPWKLWYVKGLYFFFRWVHFAVEKLTCRHIDYFTFVTKYVQNFYERHYSVKSANGCVIYNGASKLKTPIRPPKKNSQFTALIIGGTYYNKGLDHAIAIVRLLSKQGTNISLSVVGFDDYPSYMQRNDRGLVNYVGRIKPDQMSRYYMEADFLLFPGRSDTFPLTVLEALQYRLPIVISKNCSFDEIPGGQEVGIIVDNFNHRCWAEAIQKNILNLDQYNRLVDNFSRMDVSAFDWSKIAPAYEQVLKTL
jgi:glycosyltransferase involved in cell wall biosynthesis